MGPTVLVFAFESVAHTFSRMQLIANCIVQDDVVPASLRPRLTEALQRAAREHLAAKVSVRVLFTVVAPGSGYSGNGDALSSLVNLGVPDETPQEVRAKMLHAMSRAWCEVTGVSPYDVMLSVPDRSRSRGIMLQVARALPLRGKLRHAARYVRQMVAG